MATTDTVLRSAIRGILLHRAARRLLKSRVQATARFWFLFLTYRAERLSSMLRCLADCRGGKGANTCCRSEATGRPIPLPILLQGAAPSKAAR
jgi:hypothetical protein